ncbi:hypothetical protein [Streptomyces sp. AcH 505]|uniref:hypothetical protein n=1 Tax=Streptomyces sp. AcH 505 TaxID=352211 RepID=UPI0012FE8EBA
MTVADAGEREQAPGNTFPGGLVGAAAVVAEVVLAQALRGDVQQLLRARLDVDVSALPAFSLPCSAVGRTARSSIA